MTNRVWGMFLLLTVLWASSFLFFKIAVEHIDPLVVVFYRVFFAAIFLLIYSSLRGELRIPAPKTVGSLLVMGLLNNAIPFSGIAVALLYIGGGLASVLNASTALFGVVIAAICFQDERLKVHKSIGVCIGFVGVTIAMAGDITGVSASLIPELLVLFSSISYALAGAWGKSKLKGLSIESVATYQLLSSSLWMLPVALYYGPLQILDQELIVIASVFGLAVFCTAFAYPLYFNILRSAGVSVVVLATITIPPVAILMTYVFLGEQINVGEIVGFIVIGVGLMIIDGRVIQKYRGK